MAITPKRGLAIAAAVALFAVLLPMSFASADPNANNTVRLAMANGAGTFTYQDASGTTTTQSFTASKKCAPTPTGLLMTWSATGGPVGFNTHSLGVNAPSEGNSGKCEQVNVPDQILKLKTGSGLAGKTFDFAELDIEAKFDAAINIRIFNVPAGGSAGPTNQVDASPGDASTMDLVITCTSSGSDCGPDDSARDNFRERVPSSGLAPFNEIWLWATATNTSGAVALEGGADGTLPLEGGLGAAIGTSDTIFHVTHATTLSVTKTADDGNDAGTEPSTSESVSVGDPAGYTVEVKNTGANAAYAVSLTDTLPNGAGIGTSWSITDAGGKCSATNTTTTNVTCSIPTLAAGASYSFHVSATTSAAEEPPLSNTASAFAANAASASGSATISVLAPGLSVTKTAQVYDVDAEAWIDSSDADAGDTIGFLITVTNASGAGTAQGVTVTDTLPTPEGTNWSIDSETGSACTIGATPFCTIGNMEPGDSYSVRVKSSTSTATIAESPVANSVSVLSTNGGSGSASASIDLWSGVLGCDPGDETTPANNEATATAAGLADVTVTRLENTDGAECVEKNYVLTTAEEEVEPGGDPENVVTFIDDLESGQSAHYEMVVTWTYERRDPVDDPGNPATVGGRTFYVDYGDGTFYPAELCPIVLYEEPYGAPAEGMHPDGLPWCITGQSYTIDESGNVVLEQHWDGIGDPRMK